MLTIDNINKDITRLGDLHPRKSLGLKKRIKRMKTFLCTHGQMIVYQNRANKAEDFYDDSNLPGPVSQVTWYWSRTWLFFSWYHLVS